MLYRDTSVLGLAEGLGVVLAATLGFVAWVFAATRRQYLDRHMSFKGLYMRVTLSLMAPVTFTYGLLRIGPASPWLEPAHAQDALLYTLLAITVPTMIRLGWELRHVRIWQVRHHYPPATAVWNGHSA